MASNQSRYYIRTKGPTTSSSLYEFTLSAFASFYNCILWVLYLRPSSLYWFALPSFQGPHLLFLLIPFLSVFTSVYISVEHRLICCYSWLLLLVELPPPCIRIAFLLRMRLRVLSQLYYTCVVRVHSNLISLLGSRGLMFFSLLLCKVLVVTKVSIQLSW